VNALQRRPALRWTLPVLVATVFALAGSAVGVISATAGDGLPHRTAAQLMVDVQKARLSGLSGTIVQNADLGLPELPGIGGSGSSDLRSMVAGSHTLRLWYADPNHVRLALLGSLGESDLVRNGTDVWSWSSKARTASHHTVPLSQAPRSLASVSPVTPQEAADTALAAIRPSTKVSTDGTAMVAGRTAYELVLHPRDARSLVGSVRIAVDGKTRIPTRVQVFPRGADKAALEVGFTSFDPSVPPASVFHFNPPPGTKVSEGPESSGSSEAPQSGTPEGRAGRGSDGAEPPEVRTVGKGWTTVVVASLPEGGAPDESMSGLIGRLPRVSGDWGTGRLLRGTLFSAVLTDDGRLAAGAVAPEALYSALARR
jgi:outer membrane lipoprotein-sorting protein